MAVQIGNFIGGASDDKFASPINTFHDSENIDTISSAGQIKLMPRLEEIELNALGSTLSPATSTSLSAIGSIVSGDNGVDYVQTLDQIAIIYSQSASALPFMNVIREFPAERLAGTDNSLGQIALVTGVKGSLSSFNIDARNETVLLFNDKGKAEGDHPFGAVYKIPPVGFFGKSNEEMITAIANIVSRYNQAGEDGVNISDEGSQQSYRRVHVTSEPKDQFKTRIISDRELFLVTGFDQRVYMLYKNVLTWIPIVSNEPGNDRSGDENEGLVNSLGSLTNSSQDADVLVEEYAERVLRFDREFQCVSLIESGANRLSLYLAGIDKEISERYTITRGLPAGYQVPEFGPHRIDGTVRSAVYWDGIGFFCATRNAGNFDTLKLYQEDGENNVVIRELSFNDRRKWNHSVSPQGMAAYKERLFIANNYFDRDIGTGSGQTVGTIIRVMGRIDDRYDYQVVHGLKHPDLDWVTAMFNGNNGLLIAGAKFSSDPNQPQSINKIFKLSEHKYAETGFLVTNVIPLQGGTFTDGQDIEKFEIVAEMPPQTRLKVQYRVDKTADNDEWVTIQDVSNDRNETRTRVFSNISPADGRMIQFRFDLWSNEDGTESPTIVSLVAHTKKIKNQ